MSVMTGMRENNYPHVQKCSNKNTVLSTGSVMKLQDVLGVEEK